MKPKQGKAIRVEEFKGIIYMVVNDYFSGVFRTLKIYKK